MAEAHGAPVDSMSLPIQFGMLDGGARSPVPLFWSYTPTLPEQRNAPDLLSPERLHVLLEHLETRHAYEAVEADGTIHLVRSMAPAAAPAPTASAAPPVSPPSGSGPSGLGMGSTGSNPLADMMSSMGAPGGMDINRMQQQLMSNPEMMNSIMNSPMMEVSECSGGHRRCGDEEHGLRERNFPGGVASGPCRWGCAYVAL